MTIQKRIIVAQRNDVIISDLGPRGLVLRKIGDSMDLLGTVVKGRGVKPRFRLEQICESRELDRLINDGSVLLYDENNNIIDISGTRLMTENDVTRSVDEKASSILYFEPHISVSSYGNDSFATYTLPANTVATNGSVLDISFLAQFAAADHFTHGLSVDLGAINLLSAEGSTNNLSFITQKMRLTRLSNTEAILDVEAYKETDGTIRTTSRLYENLNWDQDNVLNFTVSDADYVIFGLRIAFDPYAG